MLNLIRLILAVTLLWSGYWFAAAWGMRTSVAGWFAAQETQGWQAEFAAINTGGFPFRHRTRLDHTALADPATGTAWQADWLELDSPAIWPGRQTLRFADTPQRLSHFDQTLVVQAANMEAALHLHPGVSLTLARMALTSGDWTISREGAAVAEADSLTLSMIQSDSPEHPETYHITATAKDFTPRDDLRRGLDNITALPRSFETLELELSAQFDKPWDRSALEQRRPQPVALSLALAEAKWGELRLFAAGDLIVDARGIPTGEIAIKAENWREMVAMARAAGALPEQAIEPMTRVLGLLAGLGGNPDALDVQLNFRDGFVALGPIPLGPAPRLILH